MSKVLKLLGLVLLCELVGILGSFVTFNSIPTWYVFLNKPFFSPPNWLFGPVWTILYAMMGLSIFRILELRKNKKKVNFAVGMFWWQLGLNGIWTPVFFGAKNLGGAFLILIILFIVLGKTIKEFYELDKTSAYLLVPYFLWGSFATILNFSVWILNV